MLIYNDTKTNFISDVDNRIIADVILNKIREKGLLAGQDGEIRAWENSMKAMRDVIADDEISGDVQVAIEYNIPQTSKRVDFILCGSDDNGRDNILIVELKQWESARKVSDDMHYCVRTFVGGSDKIVAHPSYQAYSYSVFLSNYSADMEEKKIGLQPCAFLHNYKTAFKSEISNTTYNEWISEAPMFIHEDTEDFKKFVKKLITKKATNGDLLYMIDNGRIRPTKALQDTLADMVNGADEFTLLDEQVVCCDMCLKTMQQCQADGKKRVIIIQGGPGTGKSVLAVQLLMKYIRQGLNASYVTKNSAPRKAFLKLLSQGNIRQAVRIQQLFRSPFGLSKIKENAYDCLIVDEAHRLVKKMYGDFSGENQVKECIAASLLTIFMLDENQAITTKDIGSVDEIKLWSSRLGVDRVICTPETKLVSQFRCNGSDSFIQFIDMLLQRNEESIPISIADLDYDFRVFDSPSELREALREKNKINNKARMVAGYCYPWNVKNHRGPWDIVLPGDFKAKWNLPDDETWAISPDSFEEVGCIHTAQGLEFDYVGVLIGKDLRFDNATGKIVTDKRSIDPDDKSSGIRSAEDGLARQLILNTYKTLLTRGQKGCYVYCEDDEMAKYIKKRTSTNYE